MITLTLIGRYHVMGTKQYKTLKGAKIALAASLRRYGSELRSAEIYRWDGNSRLDRCVLHTYDAPIQLNRG